MRSVSRTASTALAIVFGGLLLASATAVPTAPAARVLLATPGADPVLGSTAPALQLASILQAPDGFDPSWSALAGQVVVLEFWATWCGPCIPALDHLGELQAHFADEPLLVLGVSREDPERVASFLERRGVGFALGLDADGATSDAYGVRALPTTFVVDREGRVVARGRPEDVTVEVVERVLRGEPAGLSFADDTQPDLDWRPDALELRDGGGDGDEVLASVVLGPSGAVVGGERFEPGSGRLTGDGMRLTNLIQVAWDVPSTRLLGDLPAWSADEPTYRVSVLAPDGDDDLARLMLQAALRARFGLEVSWEERELDVYRLRRRDPGSTWDESSAPESERTSSAFGGGLTLVGQPVEFMRAWFENVLQRPVLDETGLAGRYDVAMTWVDSASFSSEVARLGLVLEKARRPVRVLVVDRR